MTALDSRKAVQGVLLVAQDGIIGPQTLQALTTLSSLPDNAPWPAGAQHDPSDVVKATSFADPADVAAFQECKAQGNSDSYCFGKGDNGIGFTGLDCTKGSGPACALPVEEWMGKWGSASNASAKPVKITNVENGLSVIAEMKDTMPHRKDIKNGAGIDLNYDTCQLLGIPIPADGRVTWEWV